MGEHIPATMCKLYLLLHSCTLCNGIDVTANVTENHQITSHIVLSVWSFTLCNSSNISNSMMLLEILQKTIKVHYI